MGWFHFHGLITRRNSKHEEEEERLKDLFLLPQKNHLCVLCLRRDKKGVIE